MFDKEQIKLSIEMQELLARSRRIRACALELSAKNRPVKGAWKDGRPILVSPDLDYPDGWRVTYFDENRQPTGHSCYRNAYEAFYACVADGSVK